ncbi:unnamed protein product, partial [Discosporangium mesarthrocarpum]
MSSPGQENDSPSSIGTSMSPMFRQAMCWFSSMEPKERAEVLTFEDPAWCALVVNMAARLERRSTLNEHVRFIVDPPETSRGRASFHSSTTVVNPRASPEHQACAQIKNACAAYGGDPPRAITFCESFLADPKAFFSTMCAVSRGGFLREDGQAAGTEPDARKDWSGNSARRDTPQGWRAKPPERRWDGDRLSRKQGSGPGNGGGGTPGLRSEDWAQRLWLQSMGEYSLGAFLANRVEARIRLRVRVWAAVGAGGKCTGQENMGVVGVAGGIGSGGEMKRADGAGKGSQAVRGAVRGICSVAEELSEAKDGLEEYLQAITQGEQEEALFQCAATA